MSTDLKSSRPESVYNHAKMGLINVTSSMCLGHESSGVLVRLGSNVATQAAAADAIASEMSRANGQTKETSRQVVGKRALRLGDKVTVEPGVTCRMCVDCRSGQYQVSFCSVVVRIFDVY